MLEELDEDFQGLGFDLDGSAVEAEFAAEFVEFTIGEAPQTSRYVPNAWPEVVRSHGLSFL